MNSLSKQQRIIGKNDLKVDISIPENLKNHPLKKKGPQRVKRVFDIITSVLIIVFVLSWLIPILALLIWLDSGYPVFFFQQRVGHNNSMFYCIKFRTMSQSTAHTAQKVSKMGRIYRLLKFDELPQVFNVLKGDMSLVGPRPHNLEDHFKFKNMLGPSYDWRHIVKPGITGLAQVKGYEGLIDSPDKLEGRVSCDLTYIKSWTILLDIQIILQTTMSIFKLLLKKISNSFNN